MITGSRAPVALEWVRCLAKLGVPVGISDTHFGLAHGSRRPAFRCSYPSPRFDFRLFREFWKLEISKWDHIIPTCEEVFYLAKSAQLDGWTSKLLAPPVDLLFQLHSKANFLDLWNNAGLETPWTQKFKAEDFHREKLSGAQRYVFKPEYTRFASQVFFDSQDPGFLTELKKDPQRSWLVQERLEGRELCVSAWVSEKKIVAVECYAPEFRVGVGASVRFKSETAPQVLKTALDSFVSSLPAFEGQIAFDVFLSNKRVLPIECNPRATSGFHLMAQDPLFQLHLSKKMGTQSTVASTRSDDFCLWWVLLLQGPSKRLKRWIHALWNSKDVIFDWKDPFPALAQVFVTLRFALLAMFRKQNLLRVTTIDIEFNGELGTP